MLRRILASFVFAAIAASACAAPKLDTAKINGELGRSGSWVGGVYLVDFFRPNVAVRLDGVRLAPGDVDSFATFIGTDENAEMMGEVCALQGEVTAVVRSMRAGGIEVTAIHNHFLDESPRIMFIHFMARGPAARLAHAFRMALGATSTPLGHVAAPRQSTPEPGWAKTVATETGFPQDAAFSSDYGGLIVGIPHAGYTPSPTHDFWYGSSLFFQKVSGGKIAATGDITVFASELNPVLSALGAHGFQIFAVHNHMISERPRLFFVHFWKVGTPAELASGLKATLGFVKTR